MYASQPSLSFAKHNFSPVSGIPKPNGLTESYVEYELSLSQASIYVYSPVSWLNSMSKIVNR